jgi:hypothetical protein
MDKTKQKLVVKISEAGMRPFKTIGEKNSRHSWGGCCRENSMQFLKTKIFNFLNSCKGRIETKWHKSLIKIS